MKKILLFLSFILLSIGIWSKTVTFDCTVTKGNTTNVSADSMNKDGITISSTSAGLKYSEYRFYNGTITIASTVGNITSVVFTCTTNSYANVLGNSVVSSGSISNSSSTAEWHGNSESFTIRNTAQTRATLIVIEVNENIPCVPYSISILPPIHGSIDLPKSEACENEEIEINISPDEGYELDTIIVTNCILTNNILSSFTGDATVEALFKEILEPKIDIAVWDTGYIKINIDNFNAHTALLEDKDTLHVQEENVATELFFSKYFEASGKNKLLAIYNGRKDTVKLDDYRIVRSNKGSTGVNFQSYDLDTLGRIKRGYLCPNEEIILAHFNSSGNSADTCAAKQDNYDKWYTTTADNGMGNVLDFSGPMSIGLYKKSISKYIDVIGASTNSDGTGDLIQINASNKVDCDAAMNAEYNDGAGFSTLVGDSINGNTHDYFLSTNRCLLIRKNTVHSGDSAVKYNVYTTQLDCSSEVASSFITLSKEWVGFQVGKNKEEEYRLTCEGMGYVGGYDYNTYYAQFTEIVSDTALSQIIDSDSTYKFTYNFTDLSCTELKVIIKDTTDKNNIKEHEQIFSIPIFIYNDSTVRKFKEKNCDECDVVVMDSGVLHLDTTVLKSRNVTVYPGGRLIIPFNDTLKVNTLTLRRDNNDLPHFLYNGELDIKQDNGFIFELRTDGQDWRWMTLPFAFNPKNIKQLNGKSITLSDRVWVSYYDGWYRARYRFNAWKDVCDTCEVKDTVFNAGEGFLFGISGKFVKKIYRFNWNPNVLDNEKLDKTIYDLRAWGDSTITENNRGWNLIGNPFMDNDTTDIIDPIRIGKLVKNTDNPWDGKWKVDSSEVRDNKKLRYGVFPVIDKEWDEDITVAGGYESVVLDGYILKPFTSFFVQLGGNEDDHKSIEFKTEKRINKIVAREQEDFDDEIFLRVRVGDRKTGCFISNKFTDAYEPGDDLESRYKIYQLINGHKLLYSAINDSIIEQGIKIYTPAGNLHLDPKTHINEFEYIYALYQDEWYDLLHDQTVDVEGEFILYAKRNSNPEEIKYLEEDKNFRKFIQDGNVYILKNNHIYNILGGKVR